MSQWFVWLLIVILLSIMEGLSVNLTTIWFVVSGICAMIISLFTKNFIIQFSVFVILGIILLITTKPLLKKILHNFRRSSNMDLIVGKEGVVTKSILKDDLGQVKVRGRYWTAYSDDPIVKDKRVKILKIDGVKLKVKEIEK